MSSAASVSQLSREGEASASARRIAGIDVARGIALLGIFFVNSNHFGESFLNTQTSAPPIADGWIHVVAYWFTNVFCTGKFFPLFSLLFGAGLAMMYESANRSGANFYLRYFLRLSMLAIFGILHILLLWSGDILLIYALTGIWMFLLAPRSPKTLLITAGSVFLFGQLILILVFGFAILFDHRPNEVIPKPMPEASTPFLQVLEVLRDWNQSEKIDSRLLILEKQIMSRGPFRDAMLLRVLNYLIQTVAVAMFAFWVILPCFCIGAAMMKSGFFLGQQPGWSRFLRRLGLLVGFPLALLGAYCSQFHHAAVWEMVSSMALFGGGPILSLAYLSWILEWVQTGKLQWLTRLFERLGRMALTGYLLESILMCSVMQHWGWGRFGSTSWGERAGYVLGFYLLILLIANLWMRYFRMGPFEWLWRTVTYLKWMPIR